MQIKKFGDIHKIVIFKSELMYFALTDFNRLENKKKWKIKVVKFYFEIKTLVLIGYWHLVQSYIL